MISILLPVMNEIFSLDETIRVIRSDNPRIELEFIVIVGSKSDREAIDHARNLAEDSHGSIRLIQQSLPMLGGALIAGIEASSGENIIMMASDLETDPHTVRELIDSGILHPGTIICTTRWANSRGDFVGYGPIKRYLNFVFQRSIRFLYRTSLTDLTFGFRLYPRDALVGEKWVTLNFAFLLESLLRPMRNGYAAIEIPTRWRARVEGESSNSWRYFISYFSLAARIWMGR